MIIGIDEAGRGPWAGPVCAAAVFLNEPVDGLADSKKLTAKKREQLYQIIIANHHYSMAMVESAIIDEFGLSSAIKLAMTKAYKQLKAPKGQVVIDGNINFLDHLPNSRSMIGGDGREPAIMAASIVAKVTRDNYMLKLHKRFPYYGFDRHKGYGTISHRLAIERFGLCPEHRRSFKPVGAFV